jgi:hypothetical protein
VLQEWSDKIVIDVTNGFMPPPDVQQAEYQGGRMIQARASLVFQNLIKYPMEGWR